MRWGFRLNAKVQLKPPFFHPFCHLFSLRSGRILESWLLKTSDTHLKLLYEFKERHLLILNKVNSKNVDFVCSLSWFHKLSFLILWNITLQYMQFIHLVLCENILTYYCSSNKAFTFCLYKLRKHFYIFNLSCLLSWTMYF